jgi:large subunit ribosomal protein L22
MRIKATGKFIKSSVQKLNMVVDLIRNTRVEAAANQLRFCSRSVSKPVLEVLNSAIANSENNNGLDVEKLVVDEVLVGKYRTLKRFRCRARGRGNMIEKPFSMITIYLKEERV